MKGYNLYRLMKGENNFTPIIQTAVRECGVQDEETANHLLEAFLQWFSLIPFLNETNKLQMIRGVDPIWHAFVLNTKFYRNFCERYAGYFVDHDPTDVDIQTSKQEYADFTLQLLKSEFDVEVNEKLLLLEQGATCCSGCSSSAHTLTPALEEYSVY